ncbi:MAG: 4Fe-4S dicluster domain-containing protein [Gemmatimonadetes bacterium]|nr:4Fe-4S dicluster domain-containing protein [Gemmatimonadota bacterium]
MDQSVTRQVFLGFSEVEKGIFYAMAFFATAAFMWGVWLKVRKYLKGRPDPRFSKLVARLLSGVGRSYANTSVGKRHKGIGVTHALIMWGFTALFIGTAILTVDTDIVPLVGEQWAFFHGAFYRWYSVTLDVMGVGFLAGLAVMAVRRGVVRPAALRYARVDVPEGETRRGGFVMGDWIFLGLLFAIGVTGYLLEGLRISGTGFPAFERSSSPVGWRLAGLFAGFGLDGASGLRAHQTMWWTHAAMALGFVAYLPYSKAVHVVADMANLVFKDPQVGRRLPEPTVHVEGHMGTRGLADFTWKQLLDFDACTKCGRCHQVCPARVGGAPLSPRDLILDLRQHADAGLAFLAPGHETKPGLVYGLATESVPREVVGADTLWACTTCLACVEICPVGIEHVPTIVGMRRNLVDEGVLDPNLQTALMNLGKKGNSFGKSARQRPKWAKELPFEIKDARKEEVEYLWFVGDFASFDEGVQETTRRVAHVFHEAGLDFGILYDGERSAGNDVRRVGEEGLFEMLAEHNVEQLQSAKFGKIVTTDPHSLNTLRNEYPAYGATYEVVHYTELLVELFRSGRLQVKTPALRQVTYHDPCYLARYNRVTEAPRELIGLLGATLVEMPRHGLNSFCCGAGGGRIWMDDSGLKERPSENRIREAVDLGRVTDFVVACPKDLAMFTAAVKATGHEAVLQVRDVVELVLEATGIRIEAEAEEAVEAGVEA